MSNFATRYRTCFPVCAWRARAQFLAPCSPNGSRDCLVVGNLILDAGELRETALLWAAVITSVFIALCIFRGASAAERHFVNWRL